MKEIAELQTCVGPCEREFTLQTQLQKDNGMTPDGWTCPICQFNKAGENLVGFKSKRWKE
jgi:hypothetical protein